MGLDDGRHDAGHDLWAMKSNLAHCPATSIVKIFMPIEVIHIILTARKNGFGKVVSDNLLMEGKFSYFNFNVLQCKKLAYFCKF